MSLFFCSTGREIVCVCMCVCCTSKEICMYSCVSTHGLETHALLTSAKFSLISLCDILIWRFPQWELWLPSIGLYTFTQFFQDVYSVKQCPHLTPSAAPTTRYSSSKFFPKWGHIAKSHDLQLHMFPPITLPPSPFLSTAFFLPLIFFSIFFFFYHGLTLISDRILFILLSLCFWN